jgi:hypothetical protein
MKFAPRIVGAILSMSLLPLSYQAHSTPSLTIYNGNFAVVRDSVNITLKKGLNDIQYRDITTMLEPDSVVLRSDNRAKTKGWDFNILEQNYLSLPINEALLLNHFEGQSIDFEVVRNNNISIIPGKIIRSGLSSRSAAPIVEMEGKTRFGLPGKPLFPALKDDALLKPTLQWQIDSPQSGNLSTELAYLTGGLSWKADYNLIATAASNKVDINGWVTFENQSGKSFTQAKVKLMAGDINKITPAPPARARMQTMMMEDTAQLGVTEKDFDEYHLYSIERNVDLNDGESKQIAFVSATNVSASTRYIYDGANINLRYRPSMEQIRNDPNYGTHSNSKVSIVREFKNTSKNGLGIALPKGRLRFYQQDSDQQLEFLGENNIDHTAKDSLVSLYTGNAFDISGERKRIDYKLNSRENWAKESFDITLKNAKKQAVTVTVVEHLYRWSSWSIEDKSIAFEKIDSQTIEFNVALKANEEKKLNYTVHYHW